METRDNKDVNLFVNEIGNSTLRIMGPEKGLEIQNELREIFRNGSTTYFNSSLFFPTQIKKDVSELYGFVRTADNYVDSSPQNVGGFYKFSADFEKCIEAGSSHDIVIDAFVSLTKRKSIPVSYARSFLSSMEMDIYKQKYHTLQDLLVYIYGSAEVIGLMMQRILDIDESQCYYAAILGRAMQYLNFIRDINEDNSLGRTYLPLEEANEFGMDDLKEETAKSNPNGFSRFMRFQLERFFEWDREARKGFSSIPRRSLVPIKTAEDMYLWTGKKIYMDPMIVFRRKVKPKRRRIISSILFNTMVTLWK